MTTISVSFRFRHAWKRWCKAKGYTSIEMGDALLDAVKMQKQRELYSSLPNPEIKAKPLSGKKIRKNYKK